MRPIATLAAAVALLSMAGAYGIASDQPPAPQNGPWGGPGSMMGPGWGGPGAMMGYGYANMGPWMMGAGGPGGAACGAMSADIDGRLAYLKAELKITEAQEALWDSYAGAARDGAQAMSAHCTTMFGAAGSGTLSLPERLDLHEQFMAERLDALRATDKALKPLYAALNDTQKQTADQLFWGPMGMI